MSELLQTVANAFWFIIPAYVANSSPVLFGGNTPMDGGKNFADGKRILGDGKTVRGFVLGVLAGCFVGAIQLFFWGRHGGFMLVFLLSFGALTGDLVGSFVKRRVGIRRGKPFPVLDQLEFLIAAFLFGSLVGLGIGIEEIAILLIITPPIHLGTNFISYKFGFKSEPY